MYTHRGAYLNALAELAHARLGCRSVYLWTLPMFHCNGWCFTWAVTAAGAKHVCLRKVDPPLVWGLFAEEGVTHLNGAPTVLVIAEMHDVPADGGTMGEIVMRGNNVMKGYFDDEPATEQAFAGGWFHSGDLAVMHPDRYIELRDRAKDIIISGGENISTIEVEQALVRHPEVLEAAVIAVPDEKWGERPKAFVTLKEGAYDLRERERLARAGV
jgi:acyl-CoA synthetase (AMP-forming)/AMP-acid ligase II